MIHRLKNLGSRLFWELASLKLAVLVLLSLAAILAVGTVLESLYDADVARHYVYGTRWFGGILVLLGLNVSFAAFSRWPWKRHHLGFLITHLGIITILVGSFFTLLKGYEGQLVLAEGESTQRMTLKEAELFFLDPVAGKLEEFPADFRFAPPSVDRPFLNKALGDVLIKVDAYIPHALQQIEVIPVNSGLLNPALALKIAGSRATMNEWVFSREWERARLALGPAAVSFVEVPDEAALRELLKAPEGFTGPLLWLDGRLTSLKNRLGNSFSLGNKTVTPLLYYPHAGVVQGKLLNLSANPVNPALKLKIETGSYAEEHTLFARFPELPSLHQRSAASRFIPRLLAVPESFGSQANEMILARMDGGEILYAVRNGGAWSPVRPIVQGQSVATGWMDFKFSIEKDLPRAQIRKIYRRATVPQGKEGPPPAIHLAVKNADATQDFWLGRGEEQAVELGGRSLKVAYGLKSKPLGFNLKLRDFRMGTNEGTQDPASYESMVQLTDGQAMVQKDHLIGMNQPLKYKQYKVFQASYQLNPGGADWSILAVSYDPGIPLKYAGAIVMVSGILLMFFLKPLFIQKKLATKKLQKVKESEVALGEL